MTNHLTLTNFLEPRNGRETAQYLPKPIPAASGSLVDHYEKLPPTDRTSTSGSLIMVAGFDLFTYDGRAAFQRAIDASTISVMADPSWQPRTPEEIAIAGTMLSHLLNTRDREGPVLMANLPDLHIRMLERLRVTPFPGLDHTDTRLT